MWTPLHWLPLPSAPPLRLVPRTLLQPAQGPAPAPGRRPWVLLAALPLVLLAALPLVLVVRQVPLPPGHPPSSQGLVLGPRTWGDPFCQAWLQGQAGLPRLPQWGLQVTVNDPGSRLS